MMESGPLLLVVWAVLQAAVVAVPVLLLYMGWRFLRAYERKAQRGLHESSSSRLSRLEESVLRIDSEIVKLSEDQRFLTHLIGERQDSRGDRAP